MGKKRITTVVRLLYLLHEENKAIMTLLLQQMCYPKDFDKYCKDTYKTWDKAFNEVLKEFDNDRRAKKRTKKGNSE